jgi:hypothetical protein
VLAARKETATLIAPRGEGLEDITTNVEITTHSVKAIAITVTDQENVDDKARKIAAAVFPVFDGYENHQISVVRVEDHQIRSVVEG